MRTMIQITVILLSLYALSECDPGNPNGYRLPNEQEFFVLAPKKVRPAQIYELHATLYHPKYSAISVKAVLSRNGEEYASGSVLFTSQGTKFIQLAVPNSVTAGRHQLTVEGLVEDRSAIFRNVTELIFNTKYVSIFIQTDQPLYYPPSTVRYRIVGVSPHLMPASGSMVIYIRDSKGIYVRRWLQQQLKFGKFAASFDLVYPVSEGTWAVVVDAFGHLYEQSFEVKLLWPQQRIFHVNVTTPLHIFDSEWGVAGTLYGEHTYSNIPSWGNASIELTLVDQSGALVPGSIQKTISYLKASVPFEFSMTEIKEMWGDDLGGKELHFKGWISDWYFLNTQNGTSVTKILKDGVKLRILGKKLRTFKPGTPVTIYIAVQRSDGTPYTGFYNRQVFIQRQHDKSQQVPEEKVIIPDDSLITYTFRPGAKDEKIRVAAYHPETGSEVETTLFRYFSPSGRYLSITSQTIMPKTDEYMTVTVRTNFFVDEVHYLIMAAGNIILGSTLQMNSRQKTFAIAVSRAMTPTAKVVAYCVIDREVILDSLIFYVEDTRLTSGTIDVNLGKDFTRDTIELIVRGSAGGFVGINGNDYEWYRRGASTFFRKYQIVKELMSYTQPADLPFVQTWHFNDPRWEESTFFSSPTTGMDTMTTIDTSGLVALTDMNMTVKQEYTSCNRTLGFGRCPNGQCYQLDKHCDGEVDCLDGYDEVTCPIEEEELWSPRPADIKNLHMMPRYFDDTSWMWRDSYVKPIGRVEITVKVPENTDPMVISGFILHPDIGLTLMKEPVQYDTTRTFFVISEAPPKICRGEQVIVMLHGSDTYRFIRVESNGQVKSYNPRLMGGDIQTMVDMKAGEMRYLMMPVVPIIESGMMYVKISTYGPVRYDLENIAIEVDYDGVEDQDFIPYILDLVNQGSQLIPDFSTNTPERYVLPGQRDTLYIPGSNTAYLRIYGDMVTPRFTKPLSTLFSNIDSAVPPFSAESYIFDYAMNLFILKYLQAVNHMSNADRKPVGTFLQECLARIYAYMQDDGSMKMFRRNSPKSVWLTAFALRYLHGAMTSQSSEVIFVPVGVVNKMTTWICNQQHASGAFYEPSGVYYNQNFFPTVKDIYNQTQNWSIPVTAYTVIVLAEIRKVTGDAKVQSGYALRMAANYLASKYSEIRDPLQVSMAAFALQVAKHTAADGAFSLLRSLNRSGEYLYWANKEIPPNAVNIINTVPIMEPRGDYENLQYGVLATSYALHMYLARNRYAEAVPIMKWLVTQRKSWDFFSSCFDSILALEALGDFSVRETNRDFYQLTIYISGTARQWGGFEAVLNRTNYEELQIFEMENAFGEIRTRAVGTGYAYLAMTSHRRMEKPYQVRAVYPLYPTYSLEVAEVKFWGRNASMMQMTTCGSWLRTDLGPESGMTTWEIKLPNGFMVTRDQIEQIYLSGVPGLRRAQFYNQSLFVYFETIGTERICMTFQADRWYPIANVSIPHLIEFRNHAEEGLAMATAWESYTLFHLHICQVCGSFQCPYCDFYNGASFPSLASLLPTLILHVAISFLLCRVL